MATFKSPVSHAFSKDLLTIKPFKATPCDKPRLIGTQRPNARRPENANRPYLQAVFAVFKGESIEPFVILGQNSKSRLGFRLTSSKHLYYPSEPVNLRSWDMSGTRSCMSSEVCPSTRAIETQSQPGHPCMTLGHANLIRLHDPRI